MTDGSDQLDGLAEQLWGDEAPAEDTPNPEEVYDDITAEQDAGEPEPPTRDYEAEIAAERARAEAIAANLQQYEQREQQRQQQEAVTLQQQWTQAEGQAKNHARTLPYDEAIEYMDQFRAAREKALMDWGTANFQNLQQAQLTRQAEKLVRDNGLSDADTEALVRAAMVSGDPNAMTAEANRIKTLTGTKDQEISALKARLERLEKQGRQQQRTPLNRVGGQNGRPLPSDVKPGSTEHLTLILGGDDGEFLRRHGS